MCRMGATFDCRISSRDGAKLTANPYFRCTFRLSEHHFDHGNRCKMQTFHGYSPQRGGHRQISHFGTSDSDFPNISPISLVNDLALTLFGASLAGFLGAPEKESGATFRGLRGFSLPDKGNVVSAVLEVSDFAYFCCVSR